MVVVMVVSRCCFMPVTLFEVVGVVLVVGEGGR